MRPFRREGRLTWELKVPTLNRGRVRVSCGTTSERLAYRIAGVVRRLWDDGAWDVLGWIADGTLPLPELEVRWQEAGGRVARLRQLLNETDLQDLVEEFEQALTKKVAADTRDHYLAAVRDFLGEGAYPASRLTPAALQRFVDKDDGAPATVRKHGIALRRFVAWARKMHGLWPDMDPASTLELPSAGPPRLKFLETPEAIQLVESLPPVHNWLGAYMAGTAVDLSTALQLRPRQVSREHREVHAPGTKSWSRDRVVRVADWAWPFVEDALRGRHPNALVFEGIRDRWAARHAHNDTCQALVEKGFTVYDGYWLRDHRHTWAVRAARAGTPIELIARQLGHKDGVLVLKVYGRFIPTQVERDRWERIASQQDAAGRKTS